LCISIFTFLERKEDASFWTEW